MPLPLLPGYNGSFCLCNGEHFDEAGNPIGAHCGECAYGAYCLDAPGECRQDFSTDPPLTPGRGGRFCLGNGEHRDENGDLIGVCCDECDYMMCCMDTPNECDECFEEHGKCIINARHER